MFKSLKEVVVDESLSLCVNEIGFRETVLKPFIKFCDCLDELFWNKWLSVSL